MTSPLHGFVVSGALFAVVAGVFWFGSDSIFQFAAVRLFFLSLPILLCATIYFAGRWLSLRRAARQPLAFRASVEPHSGHDTMAIPAEHLTLQSRAGNFTSSRYRAIVAARTFLIDLCRIFLVGILVMVVLDLVSYFLSARLPFSVPVLLVGLLFHDWSRKAAPAVIVALEAADQLGLLSRFYGVLWLNLGEHFFYIFYMTVAFACLLVAVLLTHGRRARILLLRPFGQPQMTSALKRVVRRQLGTIGSVVTLSDKDYRPSTAMVVLQFIGGFAGVAGQSARHLFGPIIRPSIRLETVWNERSYHQLARRLSRTFALDAKSAYAGNQAFNVASSDDWWQRCIDLMMHSSDIIVMDVSRVSTGSAWEIGQLGRRNLMSRTVFIVQETYAKAAEDLAPLFPGGAIPPLQVFRESGAFVNPSELSTAMDSVLGKNS